MKKIFVLLLCVCSAAGVAVGQVASGATGSCTWALTGPYGSYTLTVGGSGAMPGYADAAGCRPPWHAYRLRIKAVRVETGLTAIGSGAFAGCTGLDSVSFAAGSAVAAIGSRAFYGCSALTAVDVPATVEAIGSYAFAGCSRLTAVAMAAGVKHIGGCAFYGCGELAGVSLGAGVETIGAQAFARCSALSSVNIPEATTAIEPDAFWGCNRLSELTVAAANGRYFASDGALFKKLDAPYSCELVYVYDLAKKSGACAVPAAVQHDGSRWAVKRIGRQAFYGCRSLASVTLPDGVAAIGDWAFAGCDSLSAVFLPGTVESVGRGAFFGSLSLGKDSLPLTLPEGLKAIGDNAFYGCEKFASVTIPASVDTIGALAFGRCAGLNAIAVDDRSERYAAHDGALLSKDLATLICCPPKKAGSYAPPSDVDSIAQFAFAACRELRSVTLPHEQLKIGRYAFAYCAGLETVFNYSLTPQRIRGNVFKSVEADTVRLPGVRLAAPAAATGAYASASVWKYFDITGISTECTITFESNGGSPVAPQTVAAGDTVATPQNPVKRGYAFEGWYFDPACELYLWYFGYEIYKDATLYAKWTPLSGIASLALLDENSTELIRWDKPVSDTGYYYLLPCNPVVNRLTIACTLIDGVTAFEISGSEWKVASPASPGGNHYRWEVDILPERRTFVIHLIPSDQRYTVVVEKRYGLFDLVTEHLGNIRVVINNPEFNGGLKFASCTWYSKEVRWNGYYEVSKGLYYSAGPSITDKFGPQDSMYLVLVTTKGDTLVTCPDADITSKNSANGGSSKGSEEARQLGGYPNPVRGGSKIYFKEGFLTDDAGSERYATFRLFTSDGRLISTGSTSTLAEGFFMPEMAGSYFLLLDGKAGRTVIRIAVVN